MGRSQWRRALEVIESVPREARTFELWWNHGWALGKLKDWRRATRSFARAVKGDPASATGAWALGLAYSKSGRPRLAERHLRHSLCLRDSTLARLALALHYLRLGKIELAEQVHLDGLALRPHDRQRLEHYASFLWDAGRRGEARAVTRKALSLPVRARPTPREPSRPQSRPADRR